MKVEAKTQVRAFEISEVQNLDSITVILEECGVGRGRVIIECYSDAWATFFGGCGESGLTPFLASLNAEYLANRLTNTTMRKTTKRESSYVIRIAQAVIDAMKALCNSPNSEVPK